MKKEIKSLTDISLDTEKYYMFFPLHWGDTFSSIGFVRWFENRMGAKVVCLIRPEQELIMRLFEFDEYELIDFDYHQTPEFWNRLIKISNQCPSPRKGKIYVAFPMDPLHQEWRRVGTKHRWERHALMFGCSHPVAEVFQRPTDRHLSVTDSFKQKIASFAPLDKIVLFSPQSLTWRVPGWDAYIRPFWEAESSKWIHAGYKVLVSSLESVEFPGTTYLPMSMEEALWLGIHCHHVVARRSGYMDLLSLLRKDATVIYTSYEQYASGNFFDSFHLEFSEIIMPDMAEAKKRKMEEDKARRSRKLDCQLAECNDNTFGVVREVEKLSNTVKKTILLPRLLRKLYWVRWRILLHFGVRRQKYISRALQLEKEILQIKRLE